MPQETEAWRDVRALAAVRQQLMPLVRQRFRQQAAGGSTLERGHHQWRVLEEPLASRMDDR